MCGEKEKGRTDMKEKKRCIHCGAELPEDASFCPVCAQSQVKRQKVSPPRRRWKRPLTIFVTLVIIIAAAGVSMWRLRELGQPSANLYEGDAQLHYTDEDGSYDLFLMLNARSDPRPETETRAEMREGETSASPSQLWIEPGEGAGSQEDFMAKVDSYSVQTIPLDGAQAMDYNLPGPNQNFPGAALVSDIIYTSDCGTNEIVWTLNMKNGDVIRLTQRIITSLMETLVYDSSNAQLDTMEDLQALVEQIDDEVSPDAVVEVYLPPVTYEGELSITKRAVHLFGSSDGEAQTTFTGTVTIAPENYEVIDVRDITFTGQGRTGLEASTGVNLRNCAFTGWDTGALAQDHAWISAQFCTFEDNVVGLEFNFGTSHYSAPAYTGNQFLNNETALLLTRMTGQEVLDFQYSSFLGNEVDIQNVCDHPVDVSGAVFD